MQLNEAGQEILQWDGINVTALLAIERDPQADGQVLFRSHCNEGNRNGRVFGGQLLGQALRAAQATVAADRSPTLLQVLFAQGALADAPIEYQVRTLQEGKRFSSRQVEARQGERMLISAHVTFQLPVDGPEHSLASHRPVPPPEQLKPMSALTGMPDLAGGDWGWLQKPCLEIRLVDPERHLAVCNTTPHASYWVKLREPLGDDPAVHAAALAYLSDYWTNTAAMTHHVPLKDVIETMYVASLNHSLWLHRACRVDDWLLFSTESSSAQNERALTNARIYDRKGVLVASTSQECLFAARSPKA
ncbi:acyl-CoA thioesterase [Noviherbaspirillum sedimenti]|uniref:Acyl-CoA thioesterase II n=1 Tax=Noviherbaspirillum sedimenti TaxID=2320865 RepID=A0A3A3G905_9BURK|nr:acyl-CoA thioesterase domain-containing protein [Noviherbaspirillum sedimenti]RJG03239.1 acyl-CoA thioesterase II [Noviherbaspirillum sedimenti]